MREEERRRKKKKEEEEERTRRQKQVPFHNRTHRTFCYSRAWKPLTPIWNSSIVPQRWALAWTDVFRPAKSRLEMTGIGNDGGAYQLQSAILTAQPCPCTGPSRSPTLGRAVASSSHCQPMGPKEIQASSRPIADPPKVHSSQKRAHPNPIKNDHPTSEPAGGPFSPQWPNRRAIASSQTAPLRPTTPMAWLQVNFLHHLQLRAWQGRLPTESERMQHENFSKRKKTNCRQHFWEPKEVHGAVQGGKKAIRNWLSDSLDLTAVQALVCTLHPSKNRANAVSASANRVSAIVPDHMDSGLLTAPDLAVAQKSTPSTSHFSSSRPATLLVGGRSRGRPKP